MKRAPSPRRGSRRGFTLVEVLVTLLIVGGIMVVVTQILTAARKSRDWIHNVQETHLAGPAIMDLIERDLRGIVTYDRDKKAHLRVVDRVTAGLDGDSLDFVTSTDGLVALPLEDRFVRADFNEVGYRLRINPELDDFLELYRREGFGIDEEPFEGGHFTFLHDRVKGFEIQVYNAGGPDVDPLDEWGTTPHEDEQGLPVWLHVRLTLELAPRLTQEQLIIAPLDKRTITYERVIRLPASLHRAQELEPVPLIPEIPALTDPDQG